MYHNKYLKYKNKYLNLKGGAASSSWFSKLPSMFSSADTSTAASTAASAAASTAASADTGTAASTAASSSLFSNLLSFNLFNIFSSASSPSKLVTTPFNIKKTDINKNTNLDDKFRMKGTIYSLFCNLVLGIIDEKIQEENIQVIQYNEKMNELFKVDDSKSKMPPWIEAYKQDELKQPSEIKLEIEFYNYKDVAKKTNLWVDFAASKLTGHVKDGLIAQEEIMMWQSPFLIGLVEKNITIRAGVNKIHPVFSYPFEGSPTPAIITGAKRHCSINGLWADINKFKDTTTIINIVPPQPVNILAMAAPFSRDDPRKGLIGISTDYYTICDFFNTAYAAFSLAKDTFPGQQIVIHSGAWGCGMFGGDIRVALFTQMFAAKLVGVDIYMYLINEDHIDMYNKIKEYILKRIRLTDTITGTYIINKLKIFMIDFKMIELDPDL